MIGRQPAPQANEGRLSGTVWSDDGHELAGHELQIQAIDQTAAVDGVRHGLSSDHGADSNPPRRMTR